MSGELVLKVDLDGDLRRFRIKHGADNAETWSILHEAVRSGFELAEGCDIILKYKDDEGDLCTLARATLPDCISQACAGPLRLFATRAAASEKAKPAASEPVVAATVEEVLSKEASVTSQSCIRPPPGICNEVQKPCADARDEDADDGARGAPSCGGYRGVGPWKLLICLGSLRAANKLSAAMIASIMLQFLPILAQRAHRKQEKLNRIGAQYREMLLPLLHRVLLHLDELEEGQSVKPGVEAFVSGKDASKLGDCIGSLLKVLAASQRRAVVAQLLKSASEELMDLLPRIFPESFSDACPPVSQHAGVRCACCNSEPLLGPRFHSLADGLDLCGECFIDSAFEASAKFECHLASESAGADAWKEGVKVWKEGIGVWKKAWAAAVKGGMPGMKGCKGKGKGKGKGRGGCYGWKALGPDAGDAQAPWMPWAAADHWYTWGMPGADPYSGWNASSEHGSSAILDPSAPLAEGQ
mmetsp:Transcript_159482/g.511740  ORF Transcript_159482/g.511740 Transcript_159482/m.511740 type:complete len:471 (-) Transcript_159482:239-1651(-)